MGARAHIRPNHRPLQQLLWRTSQSNTVCTPSLNAHRMLTLRLKAPVRRLNGLPDIRPSDFASPQRGETGQREEPASPHSRITSPSTSRLPSCRTTALFAAPDLSNPVSALWR